MKIWGFVLALVCALPLGAFAQMGHPGSNDQDNGQYPPTAPSCGMQGDWQIVSHVCASGAWPADFFVPGRDRYELILRDATFTNIANQGPCSRWSEGYYTVANNVITLTVTRSGSTCGPADFGTFSYVMGDAGPDAFTVFIGPYQFGGACPPGDILQNTFARVQ